MSGAREVVFVAGKDPLEETAGGHSAFVRSHARAARAAGWRPHLFCMSVGDGLVETDFGAVHRVRAPLPWLTRRGPPAAFRSATAPLYAPLLARAVTRFLAERPGVALVHGFGFWAAGATGAAAALRRRGRPARALTSAYATARHEYAGKWAGVSAEHGLPARLRAGLERGWGWLAVEACDRRGLRDADLVLVNYASVERLVGALAPRAEVRRVPYCPESAFLRAGDEAGPPPPELARLAPAGAPLVVCVARQDPRKGVDRLLHALAALRRNGVPLRACLVGGGDLLEAHRRLADRLGLAGCATLTGVVPDPWPYLEAADLFVLPSLEESSGSLALLEAFQAGLPAVVSDVDGLPEDADGGACARLVPPGRPEALAEAIGGLLECPQERRALGARARQRFLSHHAPPLLVDALSGLYEEQTRAADPGAAAA